MEDFVESVHSHPLPRVPGTAVYMFPDPDRISPALLANLRANHSLHETVVLLAVHTLDQPKVLRSARTRVKEVGNGFYQVTLTYGFADQPNVPRDLDELIDEPDCDPDHTTFFLGRETVRSSRAIASMARWRESLFALLPRNASSAADYFHLPPGRVVEIGSPVDI